MSEKVKVRVAVAVDSSGHWNAVGWCCDDEAHVAEMAASGMPDCERDPALRIYWLSAEVDVPPPHQPEVAAAVEPASETATAGEVQKP